METILLHALDCGLRVSLIAAVAILCLAIAGRRRPATRAAIATIGLMSILVVTVAAAVPLPGWCRWDPASLWHRREQAVRSGPERVVEELDVRGARPPGPLPEEVFGPEVDLSAAARRLASVRPGPSDSQPDLWPLVAVVLLGGGAVCAILRLGWSLATALRIGRRSHVIPDTELHALAAEMARELNCPLAASLRESPELNSAAAIGWPRAAVVLPIHWREWSPEELRGVLAHELAHVLRWDFLTRCIALLAGAVHFYHPLVRWLVRRVVLNQELSADELATLAAGGRRAYLHALSRLALREDDRSRSGTIAGLLPVFSGFLIRRIEMLKSMNGARPVDSRRWLRWTAGGLLVVLSIAVAGMRGTAAPPADSDAAEDAGAANEAAVREIGPVDPGAVFRRAPIDPSAVVLPNLPPEHAFSQGAFVIRVGELLKRPGVERMFREASNPAEPNEMSSYWKVMFDSNEAPDIGLGDIDYVAGNLHLTLTPIADVPAGTNVTTVGGDGTETRRLMFGANLIHVRLRKTLDWQQFERCLPKATREEHAGVPMLKLTVPEVGAAPFYVFPVDERTVGIALHDEIARRFIEKRSEKPAAPAWIEHWRAADGGLVTILAPSPAAAWAVVSNDLETGWLVPSAETQPASVKVHVADRQAADSLHARLIAMREKSPCVAAGIDWADESDIVALQMHLACGPDTPTHEARDLLEQLFAPMRQAALDSKKVDQHIFQFLNNLSIAASDGEPRKPRGVAIQGAARLPLEALLFGEDDSPVESRGKST